MSYSFNVRAANKLLAGSKIAEEMAAVTKTQPVHEAERDAVTALAQELTELLRIPGADELVDVHISGSVAAADHGLHSVQASVRAAVIKSTS